MCPPCLVAVEQMNVIVPWLESSLTEAHSPHCASDAAHHVRIVGTHCPPWTFCAATRPIASVAVMLGLVQWPSFVRRLSATTMSLFDATVTRPLTVPDTITVCGE